jgi:hypothetical protein
MQETGDRQKVICGSVIEGNWIHGDRFAQKTQLEATRFNSGHHLARRIWTRFFSTISRFDPTGPN